MAHPVTLIPGDGIGPELAEATRRVLDASGAGFEWEVVDAGEAVIDRNATPLQTANSMQLSDGLFLDSCRTVAAAFEGRVDFEDRIVDNMCMQLVQKPELYDVIVLPNLYGDIVSDLAAGLVGGLGVAPGANIGEGAALFEPTHGSAPKYAGQNKVNPMAMMLSGVMMLRHLGESDAADRLEAAIAAVIADG